VVGELKVQRTVRTTVPGGCWTRMMALVNATSVIFSVQLEFGQPGAPGIGVTGRRVLTLNDTLPFLISLAGIACVPVSVTAAGFWPGGWFAPDGLVQVAFGFPVAVNLINTSAFPRPARSPVALSVRPLSVNAGSALGPPFRWTLLAIAATGARATSSKVKAAMDIRRMALRSLWHPCPVWQFPLPLLHGACLLWKLNLSMVDNRRQVGCTVSAPREKPCTVSCEVPDITGEVADSYRIDVDDLGEPGAGTDTFKIRTASGLMGRR
jgi:hypothetical protein